MQLMTTFNRGDVVLLPFPISDTLSTKKRPALILAMTSREGGLSEITIAQITGHTSGPKLTGEHAIQNWQEAGLLRPSVVRLRLATVPTTAVFRKIGALAPRDLEPIGDGVKEMLGL